MKFSITSSLIATLISSVLVTAVPVPNPQHRPGDIVAVKPSTWEPGATTLRHQGVVVDGPDTNNKYKVAHTSTSLDTNNYPHQGAASDYHPEFKAGHVINTGPPVQLDAQHVEASQKITTPMAADKLASLKNTINNNCGAGLTRRDGSCAFKPKTSPAAHKGSKVTKPAKKVGGVRVASKNTKLAPKVALKNKLAHHNSKAASKTHKLAHHKSKVAPKKKQAHHKSKVASKKKQAHHKSKVASKKKQAHHKSKVASKIKQAHHKSKLASKIKQAPHKSRVALKNKQAAHKSKVALKNEQAAHKSKVALKNEQAAHKSKVALKNKQAPLKSKVALKTEQAPLKSNVALKTEQAPLKSNVALKNEQAHHNPELASKDQQAHHNPEVASKNQPAHHTTPKVVSKEQTQPLKKVIAHKHR